MSARAAAMAPGEAPASRFIGPQRWTNVGVVAALTIAASVLLTWSDRYCGQHGADSLIPPLMAIQRVGTYFWGQDRLGSLFPALTSWITRLDWNLVVQVLMRAASSTLSPLFVIVLLRPRAPIAWTFAASLAVFFVCDQPIAIWQYWVNGQPYGPSLALLALVVVLVRRSGMRSLFDLVWLVAAFAVAVLAFWLNAGLITVAGPVFGLVLLYNRDRETLILLVLSVAAFFVATRFIPVDRPGTIERVLLSWKDLQTLPDALAQGVRLRSLLIVTILGAFATVWILVRGDRAGAALIARSALTVLALIFAAAAIVQLQWIQLNHSDFRYFAPYVHIYLATIAVLACEFLWLRISEQSLRRGITLGASLAGLGAIALAAFPIDPQCRLGDRPRFAETDAMARMAVATGARFIAGNYDATWPAVFEANRLASSNRIYGATSRGIGVRPVVTKLIPGEPEGVVVCLDLGPNACVFEIVRSIGHGALAMAGPAVAAETLPNGEVLRAIRYVWSDLYEIPVEPRDFKSQVGHLAGGVVRVGDGSPAGYALFGPYMPLRPDTYTVTVMLACRGDLVGTVLDAVAGKGVEVLGKLRLTPQLLPCDGAPHAVSFPVRLSAFRSDVEFRVYYGGGGMLEAGPVHVRALATGF